MKTSCALFLLLIASSASAQYYRPYHRGYGGYGGGYASTPAQGYAYGMASIARAQGQYNLQTAQAAIAAQQAYSAALDNKLKATQTYFEMRKMNHDYVAAEAAARHPVNTNYITPGIGPKIAPLSVSQLDPVTGQIGWTPALMAPEYASYRQPFDEYFHARAEHRSTANAAAIPHLRDASSGLMAELNKHIDAIHPQDWVDAKRLVEGLLNEATKPAS